MNYRPHLITTALFLLIVLSPDLASHPASAQTAAISNLTIAVDRSTYLGPCPVQIKLTGKLQANEPLGMVRYQFVHSDGTASPVAQLNINRKDVFIVEETLLKNSSWNDTVYLRVFVPLPMLTPITLDSNRIAIKGECQEVRAAPRQTSPVLPPASGRFRVTFNGFTCNQQTLDAPLGSDGADDEVFVFTKSFFVERRGDGSEINVSPPSRRRTQVIGDTATGYFPGRVQGGSSRTGGANGGFRAGDSFPTSPEKLSTNPQPYSLPQLIWEGELTRRQNAVVVIPTIWEWDGSGSVFSAWESATLDQFYDVGNLIANPNLTDQDLAKAALSGEVMGQVWTGGRLSFVLHSEDLPIGMIDYDGRYRFRPKVLILTYDEALRMAQSQRTRGKTFPIVYANPPLLGGNYTVYIQVEQLP